MYKYAYIHIVERPVAGHGRALPCPTGRAQGVKRNNRDAFQVATMSSWSHFAHTICSGMGWYPHIALVWCSGVQCVAVFCWGHTRISLLCDAVWYNILQRVSVRGWGDTLTSPLACHLAPRGLTHTFSSPAVCINDRLRITSVRGVCRCVGIVAGILKHLRFFAKNNLARNYHDATIVKIRIHMLSIRKASGSFGTDALHSAPHHTRTKTSQSARHVVLINNPLPSDVEQREHTSPIK